MLVHPRPVSNPRGSPSTTFVIHDHHGEGEAPVAVALTDGHPGRSSRSSSTPASTTTACIPRRRVQRRRARGHPLGVRRPRRHRPHGRPERADGARAVRHGDRELVRPTAGLGPPVPPTRQRWIGDGERFRSATAPCTPSARPSTTRRPRAASTTRSRRLLDVGRLRLAVLTPTATTRQRPGVLAEGQHMFDRYVSPWLDLVDDRASSSRTTAAGARPDRDGRLPHAGDPRPRPRRRWRSLPPGPRPRPWSSPSPTRPCSPVQLAIEGVAA